MGRRNAQRRRRWQPSARVMRLWLLVAALLAHWGPVAGQVRIKIAADGSKVIYNDPPRGRPAAGRAVRRVDQSLEATVRSYAERQGLDPQLVLAVVQVESAFNPRALSAKGAMGLMQLMPATAEDYGVSDPYDADENLAAGTRYLRRQVDRFDGVLELALAAYNAGPEAVVRFGGVPPYPETVSYVEKVVRIYRGDSSFILADSPSLGDGRRTYLARDSRGRLMMTTSPPTSQ